MGRTRRTLNQGAVVDTDGYAYVVGCFHVADFEDLCSLAQVLPADAAAPTAYLFRDVFMSGDVGHRKGLAVYSEVATLGCGSRVAFY